MRVRHARRTIALLAVLAPCVGAATACAPSRPTLPSGPGTPLSNFESAFDEATAACRTVRTIAAELRLSGRAGEARIRGRILAGLARPGAVRLEGVAPFGPPGFILVSQADRTALLLPRDSRVLIGAAAADIVHALAGVALGADDLRVVLSGCVPGTVRPVSGRRYGDWSVIETTDGGAIYLRPIDDVLRIVAVRRAGLLSEYEDLTGRIPGRIRLTSVAPTVAPVALTVTLSQVRINTALEPSVFMLDIPPGAAPLTLDELRAIGPLRDAAPAQDGGP